MGLERIPVAKDDSRLGLLNVLPVIGIMSAVRGKPWCKKVRNHLTGR